jgi:ketosteroid isomerase-like protein
MSTATLTNNATKVASIYEAFGRRDIPYIINQVADDCKWIGAGEGYLPAGGKYIGREAQQFFKRLDDCFDFTAFNPVSISNITDTEVVAFGNLAVNSKKTGKSSTTDWAMHWKFNGEGKVIYYQDFFDTASAYVANQ